MSIKDWPVVLNYEYVVERPESDEPGDYVIVKHALTLGDAQRFMKIVHRVARDNGREPGDYRIKRRLVGKWEIIE